jgi:Pentapeptide repeats (8 copies)
MPEGWAALPRSVRGLAVGIAVVLLLAVAWALFVPAADWLAHHDVGSVTGSLHETALDDARNRLLTLGAGLFAAGALIFTARNFTLSREGQVTDRFTKAIDHLGSSRLDVRIGGIYALERVARDSRRDHPTVMEVLASFIRRHSHEQWPLPEPDHSPVPERDHPTVMEVLASFIRRHSHEQRLLPESDHSPVPEQETRPDVQAALTVIGDRKVRQDGWRYIFLNGAVLPGALLFHANLTNVRLVDADLTGTSLIDADLTKANLTRAILHRANLTGANFTKANLTGAHLSGAFHDFGKKLNFAGADLSGADFTDAKLPDANYTDARPDSTTKWPEGASAPEGWKLDVGSGCLKRADPDSDPNGANQVLGGSSE